MTAGRRLWISFTDHECAASVFQDMFPQTLPFSEGADVREDDVVIFSGGVDINPQIYGERRSEFTQIPNNHKDDKERVAFRRAQAAGAACIGICRGAQLLCVLSGGKLLQHVTGHNSGKHSMMTKDGEVIITTSVHHQMMYPYPTRFEWLAWSMNVLGGIYDDYGKTIHTIGKEKIAREPEVIWFPETRSLCIQGHPEYVDPESAFPKWCREMVHEYIFRKG